MDGFERLAARIRSEYREMPGLRLTFQQACRLWQLDAQTCEAVLTTLVSEQFLRLTPDGTYAAWPTTFAQLRAREAPPVPKRRRA